MHVEEENLPLPGFRSAQVLHTTSRRWSRRRVASSWAWERAQMYTMSYCSLTEKRHTCGPLLTTNVHSRPSGAYRCTELGWLTLEYFISVREWRGVSEQGRGEPLFRGCDNRKSLGHISRVFIVLSCSVRNPGKLPIGINIWNSLSCQLENRVFEVSKKTLSYLVL